MKPCQAAKTRNKQANLQPALQKEEGFASLTIFVTDCRFNGVYSRDNLPKIIKNGAYVINLDEYADGGTHWFALHVKNNEVIYFDSFGLSMFLKKSKDLLDIKTRKQTYLEYKQSIQ